MAHSWKARVQAICKEIVLHEKKIEEGEEKARVVAYYLKLVELKKEANAVEASPEKDKLEVDLGEDLEFLYARIDADHPLRSRSALHLPTEQNNASGSSVAVARVPFGGEDRRLWPTWRDQVEREVVLSTKSEVEKFGELLARVRHRSKAGELVLRHAGPATAFQSALTALD